LRSIPIPFVLALGLACSASPARAAATSYHVSGSVLTADFPDYHVLPGVAAGDTITGTFTYDPTGGALQAPPSAFDFYVGQLRFRSGPSGIRITSGLTTGPSGAAFSLQNGGLGSTVSSDFRLFDVFTLLQLQNGAGSLNLSGLVNGAGPGRPAESFRVGGTVSLAAEPDLAPEPGSLVLLWPGLAALALARFRNRPETGEAELP
jgi:hypothetical protein